jgi:hypothetical protein
VRSTVAMMKAMSAGSELLYVISTITVRGGRDRDTVGSGDAGVATTFARVMADEEHRAHASASAGVVDEKLSGTRFPCSLDGGIDLADHELPPSFVFRRARGSHLRVGDATNPFHIGGDEHPNGLLSESDSRDEHKSQRARESLHHEPCFHHRERVGTNVCLTGTPLLEQGAPLGRRMR